MIDLITLDEAKIQCQIVPSNTAHDAFFLMHIPIQSSLVMDYAKLSMVPEEWIVDTTASPITYTVPSWAKFATLAAIAEAWVNRESGVVNVLSDAVKNLIPRTPTLA